MNNKEFDDIIKKKLESLNSSGTDGGWDTLKKKWEQSSTSVNSEFDSEDSEHLDSLFDAKLKQNLSRLRLPNNSAHWIRLKSQLESEALFKKRLFVAKTVEVLMLALIVVGILNLMPIQNEIYKIPVTTVPMVAEIQVDKATAEKYENDVISKDTRLDQLNYKLHGFFQKDATSVLAKNENLIQRNENRLLKKPFTLNPNLNILYPYLIHSKNITPSVESGETMYIVDETNDMQVSVLQDNMSQLLLPIRPLGLPDITLGSNNKVKSNEKSYVSLAIGPKVNLVNSPFDPVYEIDPYSTLNTNFNVSAKLHKELGPLEIYAGLGYSKTSYKPLIVEEIYKTQTQQYNQASLENIGFSTLNVPVGIKYNLLDQDNYKLYATAGVDVNLIAKAEYEVYDLPATGSRTGPSAGFKPSLDRGKPEINEGALLSQKVFREGILDGGSLKDNLYATANIGVGLVKDVSETTSLFVEPKYSHFISSQGLGPNLDKLHSVSVDIGIRYQLN